MPAAIPIAASVAGAAVSGMMAKKGGSQQGSTTTTQTSEPWGGLQPYLSDVYARAQAQANQGAYGGPYISPWSPYSQQAIAQTVAGANDQNSLVSQAQRQLGKTIGGDYLSADSNPYFQGAVEQALNQVRRQTSSAFSGENVGSSANQEWLNRQLAESALPMYAQNYQNERQNQLNALMLAPQLQPWQAQQLAQAGAAQESRGQAEIQAAQQQHYAPWDVLSRYGNILGTVQTPNSSTISQPYYTNPWASTLGGAISGAQLGSQIGGYFNQPDTYGSFMRRATDYGLGSAFSTPTGIYG